MSEALSTIVSFLDKQLDIAAFKDASHNGLQVESKGKVKRVCCGVDASLSFFKAAREKEADLLICHHGVSWGDSLARITDVNYRRIRYLIENDMALYACHLPLDAHPVYGNNALIADSLKLQECIPFGDYHGQYIGTVGKLPAPLPYDDFQVHVKTLLSCVTMQTMDFGKDTVHTIAIVSGGAADMVAEAGRSGVDVLITGEPALSAYSFAEEYGVNVIFAGHYATEIFGVRALGNLLEKHFGVKSEFINLNVPF